MNSLMHNPYAKSEETKRKISEAKLGKKNSKEHNEAIARGKSKAVVQISKEGNIIKTYDSALAAKEDGFNPAHIISCCRGHRKYHLCYKWEYLNKEVSNISNKEVDCWLNIMETGEIIATEYEALFDAFQSFKVDYITYNKIKEYNDVPVKGKLRWKIVCR